MVSDEQRDIDDETRDLMAALLEGVPREREDRHDEQQGRWLLAELLDYHRREQRVVWWSFFDLCGMDHEQLLDEPEAITGLEPVGEPEVVSNQGATAQWFSFPAQDFRLGPGDVTDPATKDGAGEVLEIDAAARRLRLKRTRKLHDAPLPKAIFPFTIYRDHEHRRALRDLARAVLEHGLDGPGPLRAARRLVLGGPARVAGVASGEPLYTGELSDAAMQDVARRLDESQLIIQGPPGSGKTYGGARMIVDLLDRGQRVGITSNSHRAICKLLSEVDEASHHAGVNVRAIKKSSAPEDDYHSTLQADAFENTYDNGAAMNPQLNLIAGTSWLFVRADWQEQPLDYLFVDEAGQVAIANAAAVAGAARNVSCSETPSSSRRYHRPPIPTALATACCSTCLASAAPCGERTACSSSTRIAWPRTSVSSFRTWRTTAASGRPPGRSCAASIPPGSAEAACGSSRSSTMATARARPRRRDGSPTRSTAC